MGACLFQHHYDRVHFGIPFTVPDRIEHLHLLPLRLGIHAPLYLCRFGLFDNIPEGSMTGSKIRSRHAYMAGPPFRCNLPEDDKINGSGIVKREDVWEGLNRDVRMGPGQRLRDGISPSGMEEVSRRSYLDRSNLGSLQG